MRRYGLVVVYETGAIDAGLAAAVGGDPALVQELRQALIDGATRYADLLVRSRCDANWTTAAHRLKSLAASFGVEGLMEAADFALEMAPGDPVALKRVNRAIALLAIT
jgi:HPt (histidine-containing phosphotransfer) domain-containing protein